MQSSCSTREKWNSDTWREKKNKSPTSEDPLWATLVTVRTKNDLLTGRDVSQGQAQKGTAIKLSMGGIEAKIVKMNNRQVLGKSRQYSGWILIRLVLLLLLEGLTSLFISVVVSKCHKNPTAQVTHCSVGKTTTIGSSGRLSLFSCRQLTCAAATPVRAALWIQNDIRWCYMNHCDWFLIPRYYKAGIKVNFSQWIIITLIIWFLLI